MEIEKDSRTDDVNGQTYCSSSLPCLVLSLYRTGELVSGVLPNAGVTPGGGVLTGFPGVNVLSTTGVPDDRVCGHDIPPNTSEPAYDFLVCTGVPAGDFLAGIGVPAGDLLDTGVPAADFLADIGDSAGVFLQIIGVPACGILASSSKLEAAFLAAKTGVVEGDFLPNTGVPAGDGLANTCVTVGDALTDNMGVTTGDHLADKSGVPPGGVAEENTTLSCSAFNSDKVLARSVVFSQSESSCTRAQSSAVGTLDIGASRHGFTMSGFSSIILMISTGSGRLLSSIFQHNCRSCRLNE